MCFHVLEFYRGRMALTTRSMRYIRAEVRHAQQVARAASAKIVLFFSFLCEAYSTVSTQGGGRRGARKDGVLSLWHEAIRYCRAEREAFAVRIGRCYDDRQVEWGLRRICCASSARTVRARQDRTCEGLFKWSEFSTLRAFAITILSLSTFLFKKLIRIKL